MEYHNLSIAQRRRTDWIVRCEESCEDKLSTGFKHAINNEQEEAYLAFLSAAEQPYAKPGDRAVAQYEVGIRLKEGRGVYRDDKQAFYWFTKAAERGNPRAQLELGKMYALGLGGVEKNYAEAIKQCWA